MPLDYYRVMGLGSRRHASREEINRAYAVRVSSSDAHRGVPFSVEALQARRRVLDVVRDALASRNAAAARRGGIPSDALSLPQSWVAGALLLAMEAGDFDACVAAGRTLLDASGSGLLLGLWPSRRRSSSASDAGSAPPAAPRVRLRRHQRRDVHLAVALSHCELAKVCLESSLARPKARPGAQKRRVAEGCAHLNAAFVHLREGTLPGRPPLMPALAAEIEATLERLVAPCALDHLRLSLEPVHADTRRKALAVLSDVLMDASRDPPVEAPFVSMALEAMTAEETARFPPWRATMAALAARAEGATPAASPAASQFPLVPAWCKPEMLYLAAVAGLVCAYRGGSPAAARRALAILDALSRLEPGLDLGSESAVAHMLLGEPMAAFAVLEDAEATGEAGIKELERMQRGGLSQGPPAKSSMAMTFIRFAAKCPPESVPGSGSALDAELLDGLLCFCDKWLEARAMPLFRDTLSAKDPISLQVRCDTIPYDPLSTMHPSALPPPRMICVCVCVCVCDRERERKRERRELTPLFVATRANNSCFFCVALFKANYFDDDKVRVGLQRMEGAAWGSMAREAVAPAAAMAAHTLGKAWDRSAQLFQRKPRASPPPRSQIAPEASTALEAEAGPAPAAAAAVLVRVREVWERERVVVAGVAALAALALASKLAGPSRPPPATVGAGRVTTSNPAPSSSSPSSSSPVATPTPDAPAASPVRTAAPVRVDLGQGSSVDVPATSEVSRMIRQWQGAKAAALGKRHRTGDLDRCLAGPMLPSWRERASRAKRAGLHWSYHLRGLDVQRVEPVGLSSSRTFVATVKVSETAWLKDARGDVKQSYEEPYVVRYYFQRDGSGAKDKPSYKIVKIMLPS